MKNIKLVAAFLAVSILLGAAPSFAQDAGRAEEPKAPERSFGPLEKSLLIPGWGQFAEGRYLKGVLFLAAEVFCLAAALRQNHLGNEAYLFYKAAATREDTVRFRAEAEMRDARRNQLLLAGAAVWALNLLDIALIVRGKSDAAKTLSFRIGHDETLALVAVAGCRF
ncbi:MAG: hypothetical protein NTZ26_07150 [Candidatus Aminicenantes bacterium]|nr:hypothetical protein [Candidatus Aminicenantes bacterium]